ncbi:hypothetical protein MPTK1_6g05440 [Marchantia polymorpha subsp. ruderalis]|nr:hypothetical protein MARPO_0167s0026 [Marchantia polymorpha]BBN13667.1 hypothetical protein Mp_6g05440 [Marchantia polymorpha subsp. ruderalis]|eukprot:PTQ28335.1 hypothetical protein MARPO_0167s0026 [Marchantia polymorpha]
MSNSPMTPTPSTRIFSPKMSSAGFNVWEALNMPEKPVAKLSEEQVGICRTAIGHLRGSRSQADKDFDLMAAEKNVGHLNHCQTFIAQHISNQLKNRYVNVLPYDDNRVVLTANGHASDYINASFIMDPVHEKLPVYIATQGPLSSTTNDFWEMILQEHCPVIIMLTQLVDGSEDKCYEYFPSELDMPVRYGRLIVTNKFVGSMANHSIVKRVFEVRMMTDPEAPPHYVLHLEYFEWPDFRVPSTTVSLREMMRSLQFIPVDAGPFVVHCSAGIGRTGTYCVIDHTLRRILNGDLTAVDVCQTLRTFRKQRYGMVQTRDQFRFCYDAVCDELEDMISHSQNSTQHSFKAAVNSR